MNNIKLLRYQNNRQYNIEPDKTSKFIYKILETDLIVDKKEFVDIYEKNYIRN